ncbi:ribosomal RNA large subunit methyltransferase I [Oxobacter pfennigii]|uniref:Ribosomal RNA large subunit methyltransferase I n=1 Tax=Oxobacter pfennigii TaxID=36849 RepID=A0A0P9ACK3_9CLOT|nr:class I SAM-dependent rRNA methyltransferase [Oxobacter pfennigii]KPU42830.1 ribosomal RNA large subunit methyltransferase I [Oxobacter pfennigii]
MAKVIIDKGRQKRIESGHPWVYANEVNAIEGEYVPGGIVEVVNFKGRFIGKGYINPKSQILVRILTRDKNEEIDEDFFRRRISSAWEYRKKVSDINCCRVVFAEADLLPALIVDKFGDCLVVQTLALGIDLHKDTIIKILNEIIKPKGIYERNDVPVRQLEGLEMKKGFLSEAFDTMVKINENGVNFYVDIENGQKTGYFLDQKENRAAIKDIVKGAKVLDCFCHTGSFSLHAGFYGAKEVLGIDISEHAVDFARKNAELNNLSDVCKFEAVNAFDKLRELQENNEKYDVVILDPPAFTKSRAAIEGAYRGYKDINLRAMKIIKKGGFLVTASCSQHMTPDLFRQVIFDAATDARKTLRQVEYRSQAKDHPILWSSGETHYLKFIVLQIL